MATIARYSVTCGPRGCYMPNTNFGPFEVTRRRDLMANIRDYLDYVNAPASAIRQIKARRLWSFIKRNGSSSAHFSIDIGNGEELAFHGLTEEEYKQAEKEMD